MTEAAGRRSPWPAARVPRDRSAEPLVYADAVVVCGALALRPGPVDVVASPGIIVEVLSKSTERYDRGDKQAAYLALESVVHFALVSRREVDGSFRFRVYEEGATVALDRIGVTLAVADLYEGVFALPGDEVTVTA